MVRRILGRLIRVGFRSRAHDGHSTHPVLSKEAFERELERLRVYAGRTGAPFVLLRLGVMTAVTEKRRRDADIDLLARIVRARVRLSDTVGWCEGKGRLLGVILCGTERAGAEAVYSSIQAAFQERVRSSSRAGTAISSLVCDMCRYPAEAEPSAVTEGETRDNRRDGP